MIRVLTENLYKAAKEVKRTKANKYLPVLNTILLRFHEGRIALTTHDLNEPTTAYAACRWEGETWSTCVPMKAFTDWLKVTYKGGSGDCCDLSFDAATVRLHVKADNSRAEFLCIDALEFPPVPLQ